MVFFAHDCPSGILKDSAGDEYDTMSKNHPNPIT